MTLSSELLAAIAVTAAGLLGLIQLGLVPVLFVAALLILLPVALSLLLVWRYCIETRGRDLRDLENAPILGQPY